MNSLKKFDLEFYNRKIKSIAGVDEAGRGPLAGPVVAAAVIFNKTVFHPKIFDSKKVNEKTREVLFEWINENATAIGVGVIEQKEIDQINILQASLKAMKIAVNNLKTAPNLVLIDGNKSFVSEIKTTTIVKGDAKSFSIAAASIIAKVTRDRFMKQISEEFPQYGWNQNKGYPTKAHIHAVKTIGITKYHRKTFLKKILETTSQQEIFGEFNETKP